MGTGKGIWQESEGASGYYSSAFGWFMFVCVVIVFSFVLCGGFSFKNIMIIHQKWTKVEKSVV